MTHLLSLKTITGTHSLKNLVKWIGPTAGVHLYTGFSMWEKADTCNLTRSSTCHYLHVYSKTWKPWNVWTPQNNSNSAFTVITSSYVHHICASAMHAEPVFCKHRQHEKVESQEYAASYHIMYSICYCLLYTVQSMLSSHRQQYDFGTVGGATTPCGLCRRAFPWNWGNT